METQGANSEMKKKVEKWELYYIYTKYTYEDY
jgi:hypothetical protein